MKWQDKVLKELEEYDTFCGFKKCGNKLCVGQTGNNRLFINLGKWLKKNNETYVVTTGWCKKRTHSLSIERILRIKEE